MSTEQLITIAILAFATSILGGMVGIGGAVILIPAFLAIPPLLGQSPLNMYVVSGITSVQVLTSSMLGAFLHSRRGAFDKRLVIAVGIPLMLSSFIGAQLSGMVSARALELLFGIMALVGAALMLQQLTDDNTTAYTLHTFRAVAVAVPVGLFGGMVGMAGGFILAPLLLTIVQVPVRVTIGSTLGIVIIGAFSTAVGKVLAGMVHPTATIAAIIGALPGMWIGVRLSHYLPVRQLRRIMAFLIAVIGVGMVLRVIG